VAVDFSELKIVMAHGGRAPWYEESMTMVRLHKNVYIDVAGLPPQKLLEYFPDMERFAHKFVFGTDWPMWMSGETSARSGNWRFLKTPFAKYWAKTPKGFWGYSNRRVLGFGAGK